MFQVNLEHFQNHAGRHQQLFNQQQWNGRSINNGYNRFPNRQQNGDFDEYAGLMTQRERQWLLNIQLLQLNTAQSHIEDYYYTVGLFFHNKNFFLKNPKIFVYLLN